MAVNDSELGRFKRAFVNLVHATHAGQAVTANANAVACNLLVDMADRIVKEASTLARKEGTKTIKADDIRMAAAMVLGPCGLSKQIEAAL
jgi:histone H3/H4